MKDNVTKIQEPPGEPAEWSVDQLRSAWYQRIESLVQGGEMKLPFARITYQAEHNAAVQEVFAKWPEMDHARRTEAFENLLDYTKQSARYIDPVCVGCGVCCRKTSPTLMPEDIDLIRPDAVAKESLVVLRAGEVVRSPFRPGLYKLEQERIKIREKPDSRACILFDEQTNRCSIYTDRPTQCRAQACWDPEPAEECEHQLHLTRKDLFGQIESLMAIVEEHDRRCSFDLLESAICELTGNQGQSVEKVIDLLAFDEHVRTFTTERFELLASCLELLFGRSLSQLVRLLGFRVESSEDGTRTLLPLQSSRP